MKGLVFAMFALVISCTSAEEECGNAKVSAHDTWTAYVQELQQAWQPVMQARAECGEATGDWQSAFARASVGRASSQDIELMDRIAQQEQCIGRVDARSAELATSMPRVIEATHVRDAARGGAIRMRDRVSAFRANRTAFGTPGAAAALAAADAHWEDCQSVDP